MPDPTRLYQALILEHSKHPRHYGNLAAFNRSARGENPNCGDECSVQIDLQDNRIAHIAFTTNGCALLRASGSVMATQLLGKTLAEARALFVIFQSIVTTGQPVAHSDDLTAFAEVSAYPSRRKCALLPWEAALTALTKPSSSPH